MFFKTLKLPLIQGKSSSSLDSICSTIENPELSLRIIGWSEIRTEFANTTPTFNSELSISVSQYSIGILSHPHL
ncbi:hypothetical protein AX774_g3664 [Zancudomyces culisetae]|uniref:Uncharacterized protein n=1 Tax=Zancudomyces culisetae TaxID=1213189 RepID=A0A1R1PPF8_ZANCU|nr:hypothetical protein AX774_g3664 [Zancudomyces culisetae]|eukprot:OMH82839.1 hypothetical protein AX774_g3664 [Zancudomyces culisetae]